MAKAASTVPIEQRVRKRRRTSNSGPVGKEASAPVVPPRRTAAKSAPAPPPTLTVPQNVMDVELNPWAWHFLALQIEHAAKTQRAASCFIELLAISALPLELPKQSRMKRKEAPASLWQAGVGSQTRFRPGFVPRKMCSYIESTGYCQKGDECTFAHSPEELQNGNAGVKQAPTAYWEEAVYSDEAATGSGPSRFRPGFVPRKFCSYIELHGYCEKGDECTFAHSPEELQNGNAGVKQAPTAYWEEAVYSDEAATGSGPSRFRPGFVPRKMCSYIESTGYCQKGDECTFAHSPEELQNGNAGVEQAPADINEEKFGKGKGKGDRTVDEVPVVDLLQDEQDVKLEEAVSDSRFPPGFIPRRMCSIFQSQGHCNLTGPRTFENDFRPGVLCKLWIKHPSLCASGDACTFAHGNSALELMP
eukprot:symbB.v1.2.038248.t1/scaffold5893.1/size22692/3